MRLCNKILVSGVASFWLCSASSMIAAQGVLPPPLGSETPADKTLPPPSIAPSSTSRDTGGGAAAITPSAPQAAPPSAPALGPMANASFTMVGLIRAIQSGEFDKVPDSLQTRQYVFSIVKGITDACGERSDLLALTVTKYAVPSVAGTLRGDPNAGLEMLKQFAQGLAKGPEGALEAMRQQSPLIAEGVEDGRLLGAALGCFSIELKRFEANVLRLADSRMGPQTAPHDQIAWTSLMSPEYRKLKGIPDPEEALRQRKMKQYVGLAEQKCVEAYKDPKFCRCTLDGFGSLNPSLNDWEKVSRSFDDIVTSAIDRKALRTKVHSCL